VNKPDDHLAETAVEPEDFDEDFQFTTCDLGACLHGDARDREAFAEELSGALRGIGFAILEGHGVDPQLFEDAAAWVEEIFTRTPLEEKQRYLAEGGVFYQQGPMAPRARQALKQMLAHQLDELPPGESQDAAHGRLERELHAMEKDPVRLLWQAGLPLAIEESLAPHRDQLDAAFCPATAGIALDPDSRRALLIALY
jgi:isopenicillin N synthase-like dioxygenase